MNLIPSIHPHRTPPPPVNLLKSTLTYHPIAHPYPKSDVYCSESDRTKQTEHFMLQRQVSYSTGIKVQLDFLLLMPWRCTQKILVFSCFFLEWCTLITLPPSPPVHLLQSNLFPLAFVPFIVLWIFEYHMTSLIL